MARFVDKRAEFEVRIKKALGQSQIRGETIYQVQKRIAEELGIDISRRTKADRIAHRRDFYKTQMIARTEILRASNLGSMAVYRANDDVLRGWEYITARDDRTCSRCAPLDGRVFDFDNSPVDGGGAVGEVLPPPIHPLCRCSTLPALIDQGLQDRIAGRRETFYQWAQRKGIDRSRYGDVYSKRGRSAPKLKAA
jgi:SPP1 gp7 family putative phage head morphogenesis protein